MGGYTTREVAELIGLNAQQVRHFVRRKLVEPGRGERGEYRFNFQDVVLLRTAKGLLDAQISPRRAHRVLAKLKSELEQVRSLSSMRIFADGSNVVVREDNRVWEVETGQGQLDFAVAELAGGVAELAERNLDAAQAADRLSSDEWYNLGLDLEEVEPEKAPDAYRKALEIDPKNADAYVNLGRLRQITGDIREAKRCYQKALEVAPAHQLALYNLGTIFDELEERDQAADYYRRAPGVPDAHYNLARIAELNGDELNARRHMAQYRELVSLASTD